MINPTDNVKIARMPDFDQVLIWSALLLLSLGLVMVYSASIAIAEAQFGADRSYYYLVRQVAYLTLGGMMGWFVFQVPLYIWQKSAFYLFLLGIIMLLLVLIPGIGSEINGSRRWIPLYIANLQPSEFMKFFMIVFTADYVVRKVADLDSFLKGFLPI
nr:FtsW/RodA/SpoVE family cell cycle protein [Nitrosomonas sp.]